MNEENDRPTVEQLPITLPAFVLRALWEIRQYELGTGASFLTEEAKRYGSVLEPEPD